MATAAEIGANFSSYQGNAGLGGGTFGSGKIDTRPIEDFARYVMLYNREEYLQRQKDAEKYAEELSAFDTYDITSSIPKDAQHLQERYDELVEYARKNPTALDYRNKDSYLKFKKMENELKNDIRAGKVRSLLYDVRQKEISDEPNEELKRLRRERLDQEVGSTEIRTPLRHTDKYDVAMPGIPDPTAYEFDVYFKGANEDQRRQFNLFNVSAARAKGNVFALDLDADAIDLSTPGGQERAIARKNNFWVAGADQLNAAIEQYKDKPGGTLDESRIKGMARGLVDLIKEFNTYAETKRNEIKSGVYTDKFGKPITFGPGMLREQDYERINYEDGVSPEELALVAQYAKWGGDSYKTATIQTNTQIEQQRLALQKRGQDLENDRFYAGLRYKNTEDLLSADAVVREFADVIKSGIPIDQRSVVIDNETKKILQTNDVKRLLSVSDPNLLREFGNIDKDGNVTNVPDRIYFDPKSNNLSLIYHKRNAEGNIDKAEGKDIVERAVPLTPTQWAGQVIRRKYPNKDIGGVNNIFDQIYNKYGRNLERMVNEYTGGVVQKTGSTETSVRVGGGGSTRKLIGPDGKPIE